jgi:hypothetical protein
MNHARACLDRVAISLIVFVGGAFIKHPQFKPTLSQLFDNDRVHLSPLGIDLLNNLQGAIECIVGRQGKILTTSVEAAKDLFRMKAN